jgi:predicted dehydrogenase
LHDRKARTVGIGLIGTGFMGGIHARAYRSVPWIFPDAAAEPDIRAVADVRLEDARAFARRFDIPEWTDDWRALLGRSDIELIDVCTPPALHLPIATEAAAAGKHVYCEKPVGRDLAETTAIWRAVREAGVASFVGFNYRLAPAVILAHELISDGRIGQIRQVKVSFRTLFGGSLQTPWSWRFSREQAGPGTLADQGSHVFDLALHLAGPIARICGTTTIIVPERPDPARPGATRQVDNDDAFAALAEFAGGATGILDASRVATGSRGELTFDIVGSRGAVRWDLRRMNELRVCFADGPEAEQGFTTIQTGPANRPYGRFIPSSLGLGYADTKVVEAYRVVDALAKGEAVSPSIGDVLAVARLIDAVERGGWVEITG